MTSRKRYYLGLLEKIIEKQENALRRHTQQSKPNKVYVEKRNREIAELNEVFNSFNEND